MRMSPLPPQAYTKETLLKAYSWLQNQNDSLKELATTPDILISLFTKAQMNGEGSLERPSIQNFKAELKNLAGLMGELESKQSHAPIIPAIPKTRTAAPEANVPVGLNLDAKTLALIHEIAQECNLSSDLEALRLLVSVGYKKMKNI